jgi:hypothetical protein
MMRNIKSIEYLTIQDYHNIKYMIYELNFMPEMVIDLYFKYNKDAQLVANIIYDETSS